MDLSDVKKNWRIVLIVIILTINAVMFFFKDKIKTVSIEAVTFILTLIYIVFEYSERAETNIDMADIKCDIKETKEDINNIKNIVQKDDIEIEASRIAKEKRYEEARLLSILINENLISINTIEAQIPDRRFISVLCYQKGFDRRIATELKLPRKYPEIFEKLGFVRLAGTWSYFIIAEDNIYPKKFRNIDYLARHLLNKAKLVLETEWIEFLEKSKENHPVYYNNRIEKENPLNFNMLIAKTNSRDMRHKFLKKNEFNEKFNLELASLTKIHKLKLSNSEKVQIKNFVLQSSMNILILGLPNKDKDKLLSLEDKFKQSISEGGLAITNFYDYHKRNKTDIVNILIAKFDRDMAESYADLLINNSQKYNALFLDIGVYL